MAFENLKLSFPAWAEMSLLGQEPIFRQCSKCHLRLLNSYYRQFHRFEKEYARTEADLEIKGLLMRSDPPEGARAPTVVNSDRIGLTLYFNCSSSF